MWALTEMIRASHTSTRIGRFDVSDHFLLPCSRSRSPDAETEAEEAEMADPRSPERVSSKNQAGGWSAATQQADVTCFLRKCLNKG